MTGSRFIGIDWGTTNRRCYLIQDGKAVESVEDATGVLATDQAGYPRAVAALRDQWGDLLVLIAGMAGSNRGWRDAGYVDCPVRIESLAGAIMWIDPGRTGILPGAAQRGAQPDVMRGEEVQFLGAVSAGLAPPDALLCQPGTHCKWAHVRDGAIIEFSSAMTGEIFALLRQHSLLAPQLGGRACDSPAFRQGLADAAELGLLRALFKTRSASILGEMSEADSASYASGVVIGSDVSFQNAAGHQVHVLAPPDLCALYTSAIEHFGGSAVQVDSRTSFIAGLDAMRKCLP